MAVSLVHAFESVKADGADATLVQPSNWNAEHELTQATGKLLGRTTGGAGATEEITPGAAFSFTGGALGLVAATGDVTAAANSRAFTLANGAVTTAKIDDGAVTAAKLDPALSFMPVGAVLDYAGSSAPSGYLLCYGQEVSRATYSALFTAIGTTYGAGDGSTTFLLPDCRGRVAAGKDDMGGVSADRLTTPINGDTLGAAGGAESVAADLKSHTHGNGTLAVDSGGAHSHSLLSGGDDPSQTTINPTSYTAGGGNGTQTANIVVSGGAHGHTLSGASASAGDDAGHANIQPTIIFNKIIRTGV